jgi:hypothetical protein
MINYRRTHQWIHWLDNYKDFGKKCMKLELFDRVTDGLTFVAEIYTHRWNHQYTIK